MALEHRRQAGLRSDLDLLGRGYVAFDGAGDLDIEAVDICFNATICGDDGITHVDRTAYDAVDAECVVA